MVKPLSKQDHAVLEHVLRYRLTLPAILSATGILDDDGEAAALTVLQRLTDEGWLATSELFPGHRPDPYFHLSEKGAQALGHDPIVAQPLKRDARAEAIAIATFCCCHHPPRELFTKDEFKQKFAQLWFTGQPIRHYLDPGTDGVGRLAFLKVDTGGPGRWDRLIDSCERFLNQRIDKSRVSPENRSKVLAFRELVEKDRFQITVLTAFPDKQRAIELEVARRAQSERKAILPIHAHVVPGLFEVLFPVPAS